MPNHPVVVLTLPDDQDMVSIVVLSHGHPEGTKTQLSSYYGLPPAPKQDGTQSRIDLTPRQIDFRKLCIMRNTQEPRALTGDPLNKLLIDTGMLCPWT